jgi:CubicO group peptidase (beta-lactamase class C family)
MFFHAVSGKTIEDIMTENFFSPVTVFQTAAGLYYISPEKLTIF